MIDVLVHNWVKAIVNSNFDLTKYFFNFHLEQFLGKKAV